MPPLCEDLVNFQNTERAQIHFKILVERVSDQFCLGYLEFCLQYKKEKNKFYKFEKVFLPLQNTSNFNAFSIVPFNGLNNDVIGHALNHESNQDAYKFAIKIRTPCKTNKKLVSYGVLKMEYDFGLKGLTLDHKNLNLQLPSDILVENDSSGKNEVIVKSMTTITWHLGETSQHSQAFSENCFNSGFQ